MSININSNQLSNIVNTYNNGQVNNEQVNTGKQIDSNEWEEFDVGVQSQVNGSEALGGAEVKPLAAEIRAKVPARHSFFKSLAGLGKLIGRTFMRACHVISNAFTRAIPKKHRSDFEAAMQERFRDENVSGENVKVDLPEVEDSYQLSNGTTIGKSSVVSYSKEEIGAALGLSEPVTVKSFSESDIDQIKNGDFHLNDIQQDPNLQNCWFLSSLTSVLSFKGASAIQKLITIPQLNNGNTADFALVKLGVGTYKVPLGDVMGKGGEIGTSTSKPWVRLLETAMQMHMVNLNQNCDPDDLGLKMDMNGGSPRRALGALLGLETVSSKMPSENIKEVSSNVKPSDIKAALNRKTPVVLASGTAWGASLKYGFSPLHAVSVQDVETSNGRNFLHILDPYGRSVVLDAGILDNGAVVFFGEESKNE